MFNLIMFTLLLFVSFFDKLNMHEIMAKWPISTVRKRNFYTKSFHSPLVL